MEDQQMISNLPLLFANGYPTSLDKITTAQLENFIPFMVQCSLGEINIQGILNYKEPEWWPEDVAFTIPLTKPKDFVGNWDEKLKDIVRICYKFHGSMFLLKFCNEFASIEPASLRFINNCNSTTSLYNRKDGKLLVTFRNENMSYDQKQRNRKCLLLKSPRQETSDQPQQQQMVEPPPFDIYLCDYCDGEFYSFEAIQEHEKICGDDDVIICDSPTPELNAQTSENLNEIPDNEQQTSFLAEFGLQSRLNPGDNTTHIKKRLKDSRTEENDLVDPLDIKPFEKLKKLPRRNRGIYPLSRCSIIPLSSPAGQLMIKSSKILMTPEYLSERLDRMERFCHTPLLVPGVNRPKYLTKRISPPYVNCTFKKPTEYWPRTYTFPRRQFMSSYRNESFYFVNSLLLKRCSPFTVRLKKYDEHQLLEKAEKLRKKERQKILSGRLQHQKIIDTIDLCSSDEEEAFVEIKTTPTSLFVNNIHSTPSLPSTFKLDTISLNKTNDLSSKINDYEDTRSIQNKYEGNFLVSQTPKPLQPSVILFSNFSTENTNNYFTNAVNTPQRTDKLTHFVNFRNQENLENNLHRTAENILSPSATTISVSSNNNNLKTELSNSSTRVLQFMSNYRDPDVAINKINSPSQISIDLTL